MLSVDVLKPYRENAEQLRARGDLRDMLRARCFVCKNEWLAPVIGRCPKCRAEGAEILQGTMIGAPRV